MKLKSVGTKKNTTSTKSAGMRNHIGWSRRPCIGREAAPTKRAEVEVTASSLSCVRGPGRMCAARPPTLLAGLEACRSLCLGELCELVLRCLGNVLRRLRSRNHVSEEDVEVRVRDGERLHGTNRRAN